ncbi:MAG: signal peptidase II [Anaerolineales bacterium]|nr:signal peptidase II [Anaerolineales bacterium]
MQENQFPPTKHLYGPRWLEITVIMLAFMVDRASKWWAADFFATHGPTQLHPYLTITNTYNRGLALGLFQGIAPYMGWLSVLILAILFFYMITLPAKQSFVRLGMAITIGGALGNMIDRILFGRVLDFISTPFRSGIFNLADVLIYVGLFTLFIASFKATSPPSEPTDVLENSSL